MAVVYASSSSGPKVTVNSLVKDPLRVPRRILSQIDERFIADKILRYAGDLPGGVVEYYESDPLYALNDPEIVAEFGEIPAGTAQVGEPSYASARKRALGLLISQEMRSRNNMGLVERQIQQIKNTIIRSTDGAFLAALFGASARGTVASSTPWDSASNTKIRKDIASAKQLIVDRKRGFSPDTLVIGSTVATVLEGADEVNRVFTGNIANLRPELVGGLPPQISGLNVLVTYSDLLADSAFVLQAKTVGGIANERPLQATPLYLWKPEAETWRSDVLRQSAVFIDEPQAITEITNVLT